MTSLVRPELPTASVGSSHATTAAVDNSASFATCPQSTYKSGKVVQTTGATSFNAEVDPASPEKIRIKWVDADPINNTIVQVRVAAQTDIGEILGDTFQVGGRCVPPVYDFRAWMQNIIRAQLVLERLALMGMTDRFPTPLPPVPPNGLLEQRDVWMKKLSGEPRKYADVIAKYLSGKPLRAADGKILESAVLLGARVPWSKNPQNTQMERMFEAGAARIFSYRPPPRKAGPVTQHRFDIP